MNVWYRPLTPDISLLKSIMLTRSNLTIEWVHQVESSSKRPQQSSHFRFSINARIFDRFELNTSRPGLQRHNKLNEADQVLISTLLFTNENVACDGQK